MDVGAGLLIAGAIGAVVGALVTFLWRFDEARQEAPITDEAPIIPPGAERLLSVISSSGVLVDTDDTVLRASAAAVEMGLVRDDRLDVAEVLDMVRQVHRDGETREADVVIPVRRGAPIHIHALVATVTSRLVVVLAEDRTQARRVEAIRRDFIANVSHELKTPIGAIKLLAEAVGEARDDPEAVSRFASRMIDEGERLTRLVQQIIDLSRLQNDAQSENAGVVKVGDLIADACEHSLTDAEAKDISLTTAIEPDLLVYGDRSQLHAAVSNLVENAVTYSPEHSRVAVSAELSEDRVRITVTDNGIGIPTEDLDRIFERFYRVDPARARATGGTGLGLSIVKHVAASNGGTVEVWSEPGLGSSFTLVLTAHIEEADEES